MGHSGDFFGSLEVNQVPPAAGCGGVFSTSFFSAILAVAVCFYMYFFAFAL